MYTKVGICEEWVLVRSNPPVRITRVFHARLKSPMIPCCAVWFLMENQCTGWQIISVIICVIFRYRRPPDNKCDLGRFRAGILHYSRFGEADQVVFRCLCVSVRVYWDNHLIHQALHTHMHPESKMRRSGWRTYSSQQKGKEVFGSHENWIECCDDLSCCWW